MTESSPSREMGSKSVVTVSSRLPAAATGALSSRLTTTTVLSSTQVSGLVIGCLQTSVEEVLAILVVRTSVSPTFAFQAPWFKAQSHRNVQDLSLLRHLRQLQVPHQEELARPWLARTTTERICCRPRSTQEAQMRAAASAPPMMVAWVTPGFMTTVSAG